MKVTDAECYCCHWLQGEKNDPDELAPFVTVKYSCIIGYSDFWSVMGTF